MSNFDFAGAARRFLLMLAALTTVAALSACTSRGGKVPYDPAEFRAPDQETMTVSPGQQRIGPLDKIRIDVYQVENLSGDFRVDAQGKVQYPLIGQLDAQGLLPSELGQQIAQRLGERYLRNPNVQVAILEQTEQTITVDGSVKSPGVLPIRGTTTLMRAVALAKGTTEDANPSRVVVFRTVNGQKMAAAFDLKAIRRAQAKDPVIYGNDIVVVDGSKYRGIWREVLSVVPLLGYFAPIIP
ncbi:MAG: polysaccharide biosynthesis/export protein [Sphingomonadales bacterium]|nr:polysaccharide biosynthesis/export protein [Sphingomonadales bacterium]